MAQPGTSEHRIDEIRISGGRPCLDFVNTIRDRFAVVPEDYLDTPRHYRQWCVRAGLLDRREADSIAAAGTAMDEVRSFREHLHALFSARIEGVAVPAAALRACDRWLHRAWADLALDPYAARSLSWSGASVDARLPLKRIAIGALELLQTADPGRLKRCASQDACGWLFYDESKAGRRRWCAMETCGTVEKMRRYRRT